MATKKKAAKSARKAKPAVKKKSPAKKSAVKKKAGKTSSRSKATKKAVTKKKVAPKKVAKKSAPKKTIKKAVKKVAPKKSSRQPAKKAVAKKVAVKTPSKPAPVLPKRSAPPSPENGELLSHNKNISAIRKVTHKAHEIKEEAVHENDQPAEPTTSGSGTAQVDKQTVKDVSEDTDGATNRPMPESEEKKEDIEGPMM